MKTRKNKIKLFRQWLRGFSAGFNSSYFLGYKNYKKIQEEILRDQANQISLKMDLMLLNGVSGAEDEK